MCPQYKFSLRMQSGMRLYPINIITNSIFREKEAIKLPVTPHNKTKL